MRLHHVTDRAIGSSAGPRRGGVLRIGREVTGGWLSPPPPPETAFHSGKHHRNMEAMVALLGPGLKPAWCNYGISMHRSSAERPRVLPRRHQRAGESLS